MLEGSVVGGKFRVDRVLAQGGMGTVIAATHLQLEQRVALKMLLPELLEDPLAVERFLREGRAVARLHSEHICRVYDVDVLDDGAPFMVMELLEGSDLERLLLDRGPLTEETAATYVLQACIGLAEAHARGIVHRDLKPANLFLSHGADAEPLVKVLDFGIAKLTAGVKQNLTSTMSVIGTPHYMSPEQLRSSRGVDVRSDVWALGTILYELISGEKAFPAATLMELSLRIAMDPPAPLPNATPEFREVVFRCLAKEPSERFADVVELADALAAAVGSSVRELATAVARVYYADKPVELSRQMLKLSASEIGVPALEASTESRPHHRRWLTAVLSSVVAGAASVALFLGLSDRASDPQEALRAPAALPAPTASQRVAAPPAPPEPTPAAAVPAEPAPVVPLPPTEPAVVEPVLTDAPVERISRHRSKHRRRGDEIPAPPPVASAATFASSTAVSVPVPGPAMPAPAPPSKTDEPDKPTLQLVDPFAAPPRR